MNGPFEIRYIGLGQRTDRLLPFNITRVWLANCNFQVLRLTLNDVNHFQNVNK